VKGESQRGKAKPATDGERDGSRRASGRSEGPAGGRAGGSGETEPLSGGSSGGSSGGLQLPAGEATGSTPVNPGDAVPKLPDTSTSTSSPGTQLPDSDLPDVSLPSEPLRGGVELPPVQAPSVGDVTDDLSGNLQNALP
jgi:hypothetical protein